MESIFLIGLVAMVVCGALESRRDPDGVKSRFARLRQLWLNDRACQATTCVTRVMMRGGKTRPVLECKGSLRGQTFILHAWQEREHGSHIEVSVMLAHPRGVMTQAPCSIRVNVCADGAIAWQIPGDEAHALCELALGKDMEILNVVKRLNEVCGATSSTFHLSAQRDVTWRCDLDLDRWEAQALPWSRLLAMLSQLAAPVPHDAPCGASEETVLARLVDVLGHCVESLAPDVVEAIRRRASMEEVVTMCAECERDEVYLRRLLRAWRAWPEARAPLSSAALAHEVCHEEWPAEERCARRFAAHALEGESTALMQRVRWFVRAAHPARSVPQRVAWCARICETLDITTPSWQEVLATCAPSLIRRDELTSILQAIDVTGAARAARELLDHVEASDEEIEGACLDVLMASLDRDPTRARCVLDWLCELGMMRTCSWLKKSVTMRRFSADMLGDVHHTLDALELRRQAGALSVASPRRRAGTLSIWYDSRGELVIHENDQGQDGYP